MLNTSDFRKLFARKASKRRSRRDNSLVSVESLEQRKLLAADVSLVAGSLQIDGTADDDAAAVRMDNDEVVVSVSDGDNAIEHRFDRATVERIVFRGRDGDDSFTNQTDIPSSAYGHDGNDTLVGGSARDILSGGGGDDVIVGSEGNDYGFGGSGDDFITGGTGNDVVFAGSGDDQVFGEEGDDRLYGQSGRDRLVGDAGDDRLYGGLGNDILSGEAGRDRLYGEDGHDDLYGGLGRDLLYGGDGRDELFGGGDWDYLSGGADYDRFDWGGADSAPTSGLSQERLESIVDAAFTHWEQAGLNTERMDVQFRVADLPGEDLGWTVGRSDGSSVIWIDSDAAGNDWYVDSTPLSDSEFAAVNGIMSVGTTTASRNGVDLLTLVNHEIGHAAGLGHSHEFSILTPSIVSGIRILPHAALGNSAPGRMSGPILEPFFLQDIMEFSPTARSIRQHGLTTTGVDVFTPSALSQGAGPLVGGLVGPLASYAQIPFPNSYPGTASLYGSVVQSLLADPNVAGGLIGGRLGTSAASLLGGSGYDAGLGGPFSVASSSLHNGQLSQSAYAPGTYGYPSNLQPYGTPFGSYPSFNGPYFNYQYPYYGPSNYAYGY